MLFSIDKLDSCILPAMVSCAMWQCLKYLVVFLLLAPTTITGYRILGLFPHPGASHFHFFHPIMRELAEAGHNVTVVSYFPDSKAPKNYMDLPLTSMVALTDVLDLEWLVSRSKIIGHFQEFIMLKEWGEEACENAVNSAAVKQVLAMKQPFDVIIMEQFNSDCMMGVAWQLQAPVIGLSSCALMPWHYDRVSTPHTPSHLPALFMGYTENMSYAERLSNWVAVNGLKLLYRYMSDPAADRILKKAYGPSIPSVTELAKKTSLMFVNQHYSLSGVKPLSPAVIELGGIHIQEAKPLPDNIQKILDSAEHGIIYVSWGSMIRIETLPNDKREGLLQAFSSFKQKIIWKWENETLPNQPANVFIQKWLPQRDILCHPKVRVFVTHGGLMGSSEAAHCGVSVVVTPMYGDQFLNAAAMVSRGMGKIVAYEDISRDTITNAINFALEPTTQENSRKVSYSYRNRIQTPQKTAVWWVEHVVATGGAPLTKSNVSNLPAYVYYSLDVYATVALGLIVCVGSWVWVLKRLCGKRSKSTDSSKLKLQ